MRCDGKALDRAGARWEMGRGAAREFVPRKATLRVLGSLLEIQDISPSPKYWISNCGEEPSHTWFF